MAIIGRLSWRGSSVCVVDDSQEWRRQLRGMFHAWGPSSFIEAKDGSEMLHTAMTAMRPIDLMLVDDEMLPMDGFLAMQALRSTPGVMSRRAVAVFMPGEVSKSIIQKAIESGYNSVLPKPFSASILNQHLQRLLTRPITWIEDGEMLRPANPITGE